MSNVSEFRQEPEEPLDRWRRREEPRPRERRLDTAQPTLDDIDRRIEERVAAEHKFMTDILIELLAQIQSDAEMRGPPGPYKQERLQTSLSEPFPGSVAVQPKRDVTYNVGFQFTGMYR
jgi:hypothetical protein